MQWYLKYDPRQRVQFTDGRSYQFPEFGNGWGGLATENKFLIREFDLAIAQHRGGLTKVTEREFNDVKKKALPTSLREEVAQQLLRTASRFQRSSRSPAVRVGDNQVSEWQTARTTIDGQRPVFDAPKSAAEKLIARTNTGFRPRAVAR